MAGSGRLVRGDVRRDREEVEGAVRAADATRRPALRETLTRRVRADLDSNVQFHNDAGLPGGTTVLLLYLAMSGVLVEYLTLPGVLAKEGSLEELIDAAVRQIVPER